MIVRKNRSGTRKDAPQRSAGLADPAGPSKALVTEGVTTQDLEVAAEKMMADAGAKPAFKGYYVAGGGDEVSVRAVYLGE